MQYSRAPTALSIGTDNTAAHAKYVGVPILGVRASNRQRRLLKTRTLCRRPLCLLTEEFPPPTTKADPKFPTGLALPFLPVDLLLPEQLCSSIYPC